jgi:dihydroflavonol-4-reductase
VPSVTTAVEFSRAPGPELCERDRLRAHAIALTTLVTGATGFIGSHVTRLLVERGDDVSATIRAGSSASALEGLPVTAVRADICDRRAIRRAMRGVQRVFHVAGTTSLTAPRERVFAVNVEGTRIVLEEALRAEVERVVLTSSVAAIGPAPGGRTADEANVWQAGRYRIAYVDSKHEAEVAALRLLARGLPLVIVNPAHVMGAGDRGRTSTALVRRFMRRQIPAYVEGTLNIVGVEDVARGHLLADERGAIGERYILGNRNFTIDRLFADLGRLSGVEPPALRLPLSAALALAAAAQRIPGSTLPTPTEVRASSLNWAFTNRKAKRWLGWSTSPHEDCLEATIEWYRSLPPDQGGAGLAPPGTRQRVALRAAGAAMGRLRLPPR